jgi:hypothetical protein
MSRLATRRYRSADRGYDERYGSRDSYKDVYREGLLQGYKEGFRDGQWYDDDRRDAARGRGGSWPWPF